MKKQSAFTLIELSIVLVIIGLIVGGVLVGKDLIRAAEVRSAVSQFQEYQTAFNTFRLKYNCIAGDCSNATQFFGIHPALVNPSKDCNNQTGAVWTAWNATTTYQTGTCNGNGNEMYGTMGGNQVEEVTAFQHLSVSGLVKEQFMGGYASGSGSTELMPDVHLPKAKIAAEGPAFGNPNLKPNMISLNLTPNTYSTHYVPLTAAEMTSIHETRRVLQMGALIVGQNYVVGGLYPRTAFAIDSKMDDGLPSTGKMLSRTQSCGVGNGATNEYNFNYTTFANCDLMLLDAF